MSDLLREGAVALGISGGIAFSLIYIFRKLTGFYEQAGYNRAMLELASLNMEALRKAAAAVQSLSHDPADIVRDQDNRD